MRAHMRGLGCAVGAGLLFSLLVFVYCEFGIYLAAVRRCAWPELRANPEPTLRVLLLSDPHLLGALRGHWLDKLRREWQMERAFQTALWLLQPELVFILGDVFDEGKWSSAQDWEDDVRRFRNMFRHSSNIELIVLMGNHDVGFHYEMSLEKLQRFEKVFNFSSARVVTRKEVNFLLVNSMALHGDGCDICHAVEMELLKLSGKLNCSRQALQGSQSYVMKQRCNDTHSFPSSPPIILQHFPLYRESDANCSGPDAAPPEERIILFREKYDVLSREASHKLLWWFQPRLVLSGHTHSGCHILHEKRFPEVSVPSFSWRNRNNPSFILGSFSSTEFLLSKCFLPEESLVISLYCVLSVLMILLLVLRGTLTLTGKHKAL